jgi:tetratricopeptide (TPR) repeat protein
MQDQIHRLSKPKDSKSAHIIEKYLGDLHYRINDTEAARRYYESALSIKRDYADALLEFAWLLYFDGKPGDSRLMSDLFREMTVAFPYDYRGFHGLGYALYMQAIDAQDADARIELVTAASFPADEARALKFNHINTVGDLGEITRTTNPRWSIFYHELGLKLLEDPETAKLRDNKEPLGAQLLTRQGEVTLQSPDDKKAWLTYQLALDYLALHRRNESAGEFPIAEHARYLESAKKLDPLKTAFPIYEDQLAILDLLLPESAD